VIRPPRKPVGSVRDRNRSHDQGVGAQPLAEKTEL